MNQIPNIEETHDSREEIVNILIELRDATGFDHSPESLFAFVSALVSAEEKLYQQLQKAREEILEKWRKSIDDEARSCSVKIEEAVEKGRLSVLEDFDALMKADAFIGLTDDEWKAVQKFFRYNDEISGWKHSELDQDKALQDNK